MVNYESIAVLKRHTYNVLALVELPQEILVSGGNDDSIMFWNMQDDYSLVQTLGVELKNGEIIQVSGSPHFLWNPEDFVKITAERYLCFDSAGNRLNGCSSARVSK